MKAYKIELVESEKGWGRRTDDWMVCLTPEKCLKFKESFNAQNVLYKTPDWYMQVEGDPIEIEISDLQYDTLVNGTSGSLYWSTLKKIV